MSKPLCIYVATRLSCHDKTGAAAAIQYLYNLKQSIKAGAEVWRKGHYPYIPGLDFMVYLELDGDYGDGAKLPYEVSLEWVRRCDAILIHNGLEAPRSPGVEKELQVAIAEGKKVYYSLEDIPEISIL